MEGNADHKSELADLTKDGNNLLFFSDVCVDSWYLRSSHLYGLSSCRTVQSLGAFGQTVAEKRTDTCIV